MMISYLGIGFSRQAVVDHNISDLLSPPDVLDISAQSDNLIIRL